MTTVGVTTERDLCRWISDVVLPYWAGPGFDEGSGLFQERLLPDGTPDRAAPRRVRVQARQIYVYAQAAVLGWAPEGAALALRAFDSLVAVAQAPDGKTSFIHTFSPGGHVVSPLRDAYDHAFIVLACSWLWRATGEARVRRVLDATLDFLDAEMTAADGSLLEGVPASLPRRQNPQMHWFEAMLALMEHGIPSGAERAARHRVLFETRLYDRATRSLGEYFTDDWAPAPGLPGTILEPGHHAEWVWLLRRHDALAGLPANDISGELLSTALRWADPGTGLLVDQALRDGSVHRATRRTWLQTELAKAWLAEAELGRPGAADAARAALGALDRHYLRQPIAAGWTDQLDADHRLLPGPVPASTLYHIFVAIAEGQRVLAG
ncbi:AGE family epimerase/isomerase [Belnapia rosea]|uniref:Mannose-6-phosphate isomerase n=1 Tax=Belnapia rosea TaxID=938405 RepID=A0A1G7DI06_9PROT|nr:AGE family epimerase/isomerase [Belnapia rosea]SDE51099.1 mannose-6-phosphate isomerase [Belnapia rosea]